jgi:hypothetical protein
MFGSGVMGNDRLEKGVRLGQVKRESDQTSAVGFQVFSDRDQFVEDPWCFVMANSTSLRSLRYVLTDDN